MVRKKVDSRVRTLIENSVKENHRSFLVIIGDYGKDQVSNLHYILSKTVIKSRPKVLWCYKKDLGFSTHKQKRMRQLKKKINRGLHDASTDDPFELFIGSTDIRWCYYKETHKILGSTYGVCVLQDFEAITPNIMARTIETVEGGGLVILLLRTMTSLKKLYTMTMDVHNRFRTEAHQDIIPRFNERFLLSLASCNKCMVLDDELNVLPISKHIRNLEPIIPNENIEDTNSNSQELIELKKSLIDTPPVGPLIEKTKTLDQAKAVLQFIEAISEKKLQTTVTLTAGRGRGKSAALGLALAAAVAYGYSNIFVTSPSPENLKTVFDFLFQGFDSIKYKEHLDYEIIQSTNPDFNKAIIRVNIFHDHRQTIQYIQPQDYNKLAQAELVIIDEAAAIPLPLVKKLCGQYLVFLSSTINGYEGTGRSLSLKLIQQLRKESNACITKRVQNAVADIKGNHNLKKGERKVHEERWQAASEAVMNSTNNNSRLLREISLEEPIRYAMNDPVEKWLNNLLCLNINNNIKLHHGTPPPQDCELYYVDRDALFSYHKLSESFLQKIMSLYVSSHYKNQPNDLQLLSDAPAHHIFVLLGPQAESQSGEGQLPDILTVVQVAYEGKISTESIKNQLNRGQRASGDLIPWTVAQQFQDNKFASLSGVRVVRIATHPDLTGMGYGTQTLNLLKKYYQQEINNIQDNNNNDNDNNNNDNDNNVSTENTKDIQDTEEPENVENKEKNNLLKEKIKIRKKLPPLLVPLVDRKCEVLDWFGTSFGLTQSLYNFWQKAGLRSVYIRQTPNQLTGEYTTIMLLALDNNNQDCNIQNGWLDEFLIDARRRFISLLSYEFRKLPVSLALSVLSSDNNINHNNNNNEINNEMKRGSSGPLTVKELNMNLTCFDIKRLESYAKNMIDYHMIIDLLPIISNYFFTGRLPDMTLSFLQKAILVNIGLQHNDIDSLIKELNLPSNQLLALFNKSIRKFTNYIQMMQEKDIEYEINNETNKNKIKNIIESSKNMIPTKNSLIQDISDNNTENKIKNDKENNKNDKNNKIYDHLIKELELDEYAVVKKGTEKEWSKIIENKDLKDKILNNNSINVPIKNITEINKQIKGSKDKNTYNNNNNNNKLKRKYKNNNNNTSNNKKKSHSNHNHKKKSKAK